MADYYLIGKISAAYGKDGFVRIISYSDFPDRFFNLKEIFLDFFGEKKLFTVEKIKQSKDFFIIKFNKFNSDVDVKLLLGKEIYVNEKSLVNLPEGFFFVHDLIGSKVIQAALEIGIIKDVLQLPANDVYVVEKEGKEILIPAVKKFIEKFDPINKELFLAEDFDLNDDDDES